MCPKVTSGGQLPYLLTALLISLCLHSGAAQAAVFKIATLSPDGSSWMKTMRRAAGDIEQQTDGRVKFKFYPGGVMGSDDAVLRKIRIGQLQGGAFPGGALVAFYPEAQVYTLPLKFRTFAEVDYVRERMDADIVAGLERGGFVTFGLGEGGFAYILSRDAIRSVDDLRAHKVWIPNNDASALLAIKTFGVSPIPLNLADVLAGLQTGLVDTVASSPIGTIALQWHTQVSHMSDLPIMYFYAVLAIDKKVFSKMSAADQALVREVMGEAFKTIDTQNRADNIAAYEALLKQGISPVELSDSQRQEWYQTARQAEKNLVEKGLLSRAALQQLDTYLSEIRSQQSANP
jgi:TRAP-type C4-dicarboxylate transport system substrate-binding protein